MTRKDFEAHKNFREIGCLTEFRYRRGWLYEVHLFIGIAMYMAYDIDDTGFTIYQHFSGSTRVRFDSLELTK